MKRAPSARRLRVLPMPSSEFRYPRRSSRESHRRPARAIRWTSPIRALASWRAPLLLCEKARRTCPVPAGVRCRDSDPRSILEPSYSRLRCHLSAANRPKLSNMLGRNSSITRRFKSMAASRVSFTRSRRWRAGPLMSCCNCCTEPKSMRAETMRPPSSSCNFRANLALSASVVTCKWVISDSASRSACSFSIGTAATLSLPSTRGEICLERVECPQEHNRDHTPVNQCFATVHDSWLAQLSNLGRVCITRIDQPLQATSAN